MNPFDVWAPIFRAPFSGDVTQEIAPRVLSPDIKGVPEIEFKVQTEVASFGKQLGKILEAVEVLAKSVKVEKTEDRAALQAISELIEQIEEVKAQSKDALLADAEAAMKNLKRADEDAWQRLVKAGQSELMKGQS